MKLVNEFLLKDKYKKVLCETFHLKSENILASTVLFPNYIDSLDYLKFATITKEFATAELNINLDMILFLNNGPTSINDIFSYLETIV